MTGTYLDLDASRDAMRVRRAQAQTGQAGTR